MDPEYIPDHYLERLREANAAIIEFEQLIASREDELRAAREELHILRERLASAQEQGLILESPSARFNPERLEELRQTLQQIVSLAGELRTETSDALPPKLQERLDEMIRRATAARDILG